MIVICMAYHDRKNQLMNTLASFAGYEDIEVIIVNDCEKLGLRGGDYGFDITEITIIEKYWINAGINFNIGFEYAISLNPEAVIIQNPECYHVGDIVGNVKKRLTDKNYLSFGCYSLSSEQDITFRDFNNETAVFSGQSAWYNHSIYRPEALHFCSAITTENLKKINGFDERFARDIAYEDNYLVHQVKCLGLNIEFIDNPYVLHQYHNKAFMFDSTSYARNGAKYNAMIRSRKYRAEHFITKNL